MKTGKLSRSAEKTVRNRRDFCFFLVCEFIEW